jgi:two-component system, NtrC family, nitrogen regulation sensor histidine kinase NtrY
MPKRAWNIGSGLLWSGMAFLLFLLVGGFLGAIRQDKSWYVAQTLNVRKELQEKERRTMQLIQDFTAHPEWHLDLAALGEEEGIFLFVYRNDTLVQWSTARVPMPQYSFDDDFLLDVMKLRNGWYRVVRQAHGPYTIVGLILVKRDYFINNEFLVDGFVEDFGLDKEVQLAVDPFASDFHVTNQQGRFLFALVFDPEGEGKLRFASLAGFSFLMALFAFLYFLYQLGSLRYFRKRPVAHIILFTVFVLLLRWLNLHFRFPNVLYELTLFNPEIFASSAFLPNLGDFLLHVILLTAWLVLVFVNLSKYRFRSPQIPAVKGWILFFGSLAAVFSFWVHHLIRTLIFDSNLSFDLSNILDLSGYSFIGFSLITLLLVDYFIIIHFCSKMLARVIRPSWPMLLILTFLPFLVIALMGFLANQLDFLSLLLPYFIFVSVLWVHFRPKPVLDFYAFLPALVLFSGFATYLLWNLNTEKEHEQRKVLVVKIAEEQDHVAEFLFREASAAIRRDPVIRHHLFANYRSYPYELFERIAQRYFAGYWSKYALVIMPVDEEELHEVEKGTWYADPDLADYENAIKKFGIPTASPELFFLGNAYGKVSYIGKIRVEKREGQDTLVKYIYLEFISKMVTQVMGFPELLLDQSVIRPVHLGNYSYAIYKEGRLSVSAGGFSFPIDQSVFGFTGEDLAFLDFNGFNHLIYRVSPERTIVVSLPHPRFLDILNPYAYLLLYFSFILFLFVTYRYYFHNKGQGLRLTLKGRIQLTILLILLVSLVLVGLGIHDFITTQFDRKNRGTIEEKVNAILSELKTELEGGTRSLQHRESLNYVLTRYANIFFTDINLYDAHGMLMASSREGIFNEGLVARQMDPRAYDELATKKQPKFLHKERIGKFQYLSAYAVFRDRDGNVIGYVNLPYFLRQNDLREELSSSLLALINIYSLLIVASMAVSLLMANRLTTPLSILQEKISQLRLGRKNEIIDYRGQDEISGLVSEYNRMVRELEQSAALLARSERESAWKEMARQVAHEVKNPLTPMKLSVQYLLKAWEDGKPDFDDRLRRFRDAMLDQIETLSAIASEFSYFAKLPETHPVQLDLILLVDNCVAFFRNNEEDVAISLETGNLTQAMVKVDRDQMLRVFNNLIRNALQAIPPGREGKVVIRMFTKGDHIWVEVADNGMGIPADIREKIFAPNFTTKGSGMGLGLAMTRTILENVDGVIDFTTEDGQGTTFRIRLPKA